MSAAGKGWSPSASPDPLLGEGPGLWCDQHRPSPSPSSAGAAAGSTPQSGTRWPACPPPRGKSHSAERCSCSAPSKPYTTYRAKDAKAQPSTDSTRGVQNPHSRLVPTQPRQCGDLLWSIPSQPNAAPSPSATAPQRRCRSLQEAVRRDNTPPVALRAGIPPPHRKFVITGRKRWGLHLCRSPAGASLINNLFPRAR